jgi:putative membrane protein
LREKSLKPPAFLTPLPSYKKLFAYLLLFSVIAGFAVRLSAMPAGDALVFGGAEGFFLIALPAFFAAVLAASVMDRRQFRKRLKYFAFTACLGAILNAATFIFVSYFLAPNSLSGEHAILLANAAVFAIWMIALVIALSARLRYFFLAFSQPLLTLAFLVLWRRLGIIESTVLRDASIWLLLPKLAVASGVLLFAMWAASKLINAPARNNFGVSATQAASLFFAQWVQGSKGLEQILDEMGEDIETTIGTVEFRDLDGKRKAVFLTPNVHFGPFGNIGGSEFPAILSKELGRELDCEAFVFHGTVYHDFNPVSSDSVQDLKKAFKHCLAAGSQNRSRTGALLTSNSGDASVDGFAFGKGAFLALSPPPFPAGDFDFASGYALALKASQKLGTTIICDRHTAQKRVAKWSVGSREFYEFMDAVEKLEAPKQKPFAIGVAADALDGFTVKNGIGKGGLKVAVIEIAGKRHCLAVFDANNMLPPLREKLVGTLRKRFGFAYCDVFTTDTHAVNSVETVHNPLGANISWPQLEEILVKTAGAADADVQAATASVTSQRYATRVLGAGKAGELASTINAIVAVARIAAPAVIIISLALALLALVLI